MPHPIKPITRLKMALKALDRKWYRWNGYEIESCENNDNIYAKELLTDTQFKILNKATILGYYSFPRGINLSQLSKELGLTPGTVCVHLQKIESKLIGLDTKREEIE